MSGTDVESVSVHEAIARVIGALPAIGKDSTGDGIAYRYRGIEAIKSQLKPILAAERVHYVLHRLVLVLDDTVPVGDRGKQWQRTRIRARWRVYGPGGDFVTTESRGEGVDSSDKAANKAVTGAEKQMLLTTFCVADGDDPDHARPEIETPAASWPAKWIKGGMVEEIARQVTSGDVDHAKQLAALAWDTFALGDLVELPVDDAREKIDAAVELARQEMTAEHEAIDAAEHVETPAPVVWPSAQAMRDEVKRHGIASHRAMMEATKLAEARGETITGPLSSVLKCSPELVADFAAWVRSHEVI